MRATGTFRLLNCVVIENLTVLILGAGASMSYGMPSGRDLRTEILSLRQAGRGIGVTAGLELIDQEWREFTSAFHFSQRASIDSFLGQQQQFREIGSVAIAAVLLQREKDREEELFADETTAHWYRLLFAAMTEHADWNELDFKRLKIITFNYDRTLERFLSVALQAAYQRSETEVWSKLTELDICHVYGSLSSPRPGPGYLSYGCGVSPKTVHIAASALRLMRDREPDNGDENARLLATCKKWIEGAERVGILGFSFDRINTERLELFNLIGGQRFRVETPENEFVATCLGLTPAEALQASRRCGGPTNLLLGNNLPKGMWACDCEAALRSSLLLSP